MAKIALLGGTFDPIHHGHLIGGQVIYDTGHFDEVWYMPTGCPPHKQNKVTDGVHRLKMCQLATQTTPYLKISTFELYEEERVYTYNTLKSLRVKYPEHEFWFVIGADSLFTIHHWYHFQDLLMDGRFIVMPRGGDPIEPIEPLMADYKRQYHTQFFMVDMPLIEISSTQLRERVQAKQNLAYFLPQAVVEYIQQEKLYQA